MTRPMIENSDRGVTLNKSLAWTVLVALVGGGFWVGVNLTNLQRGVDAVAERQREDRAAIQSNTRHITQMLGTEQRVDQRLTNIEQSMQRFEGLQLETLRYLRGLGGDTP